MQIFFLLFITLKIGEKMLLVSLVLANALEVESDFKFSSGSGWASAAHGDLLLLQLRVCCMSTGPLSPCF